MEKTLDIIYLSISAVVGLVVKGVQMISKYPQERVNSPCLAAKPLPRHFTNSRTPPEGGSFSHKLIVQKQALCYYQDTARQRFSLSCFWHCLHIGKIKQSLYFPTVQSAIRKPRYALSSFGGFLARLADRSSFAPLPKLPPRFTL